MTINSNLPYVHKVLLKNLESHFDGVNITSAQIDALRNWQPNSGESIEVQFTPERVVMQDFTGVPCLVDLASMREVFEELGGDPKKINPLKQTDLIIDHSVQIDYAGTDDALEKNLEMDYSRNAQRYRFLKWGSNSFTNFAVVPPSVGIIHQVNLEKLAQVVMIDQNSGKILLDTCVGTDSHTTMVNALGVLGWGVGGIEAESALLGQSIPMLIPEVVGFELVGKLNDSVTITDAVLTIVEMLRKEKVVGKFVEFYGEGVNDLSIASRATISNMCPEFGATAAIFAIDEQTIKYLDETGRDKECVQLVEKYAKENGLWASQINAKYSNNLKLDLSSVQLSVAGPKRPQDRINLKNVPASLSNKSNENTAESRGLKNNDIVLASITSCTNTSNPAVLIGAALLAKKCVEYGLKPQKHVRTSFAPGSRVVTRYLNEANLQKYLNRLGFNTVGYGCATCIGNSGPLDANISAEIESNDLEVAAVLSGNRNFEGRINKDVKLNFLASPPLVVAYAIAGTLEFDFDNTPLGQDKNGNDIFLKDVWPNNDEIEEVIKKTLTKEMFINSYQESLKGDSHWQSLKIPDGSNFEWDEKSTYIRKAPFFEGLTIKTSPVKNITGAKVLALLGDSITTDHISPAGSIALNSPAAKYLEANGETPQTFNSYGSRRGNHEVMVRGTFANIRLNNLLIKNVLGEEKSGGWTVKDGLLTTIYEASEKYREEQTPLIIIAGNEYGTGSSRDWAAKGTSLLGVKAVFAQSFERIHRSNLIGMGVLPLQFLEGDNAEKLGLDGTEVFDILDIDKLNNQDNAPETLTVIASKTTNGFNDPSEKQIKFQVKLRIDTVTEKAYYLNGGILQYVLRNILNQTN